MESAKALVIGIVPVHCFIGQILSFDVSLICVPYKWLRPLSFPCCSGFVSLSIYVCVVCL